MRKLQLWLDEQTGIQNSQNPAFNLGLLPLLRLDVRMKICLLASIGALHLHPLCDGESVLLVGRSSLVWECPVPERRINLGDHGATEGNVPTVERPEMDAVFDALPNISQTRNSRV